MVKGNAFFTNSTCDTVRGTEEIKFEISKSSHRSLDLTPRTEASTPESGEHKTYNTVDSSTKDDSSVDRGYSFQRHMSQTDDHIQLLDRNGDLNEVAGSQSMLSQELFDHARYQDSQDDNDRNEDNSGNGLNSSLLGDLGLPEGSSPTCSVGIAKHIGLLTQTQEEEEEATDTEKLTPSPKNDSSKKGAEKPPLSGLELLTQVGIKEANKNPSLSTTAKSKINKNEDKNKDKDTTTTTANPSIFREHEGFGSLLDAVAKITEQEASQEELSMNWQPSPSTTSPPKTSSSETTSSTGTKTRKNSKKRKAASSLPTTKSGSSSKQRKSEVQKLKERLRREKIEQENERAQAIAKKAAMIAERTITDPVIAKKLLLSMALARENPRSVPQALPGSGHVVQEGFFWAHYPPLEFVLKKHMAEYYELSTHQCQSRQQQAFNNYMVDVVKDVAEQQQWAFASSFNDKSLRDRIRCYYKTHIQNAKKRLRTMVRNPTKRANARHLCEHVELIEQHRVKETQTEPKSTFSDQKKIEK